MKLQEAFDAGFDAVKEYVDGALTTVKRDLDDKFEKLATELRAQIDLERRIAKLESSAARR